MSSRFDAPYGPDPAANGEHRAPPVPIDPEQYRSSVPPPGGEGASSSSADAGSAPGGPEPIPHTFIASSLARLASAGIADPAEVQAFQTRYAHQLEELFGWLDFSDALAEYGIAFGDAAPMPAWMRLAGGIGGAGVLLLMQRPELIGRMSAAMKRSRENASASSSAEGGDDDARRGDSGGGLGDVMGGGGDDES